jgi:hypothetical protein
MIFLDDEILNKIFSASDILNFTQVNIKLSSAFSKSQFSENSLIFVYQLRLSAKKIISSVSQQKAQFLKSKLSIHLNVS